MANQPIVRFADFVIAGEADLEFAALCEKLLRGDRPRERTIQATLPDLQQLTLPYDLYSEADLAHRVIYVEASRGCPFTCEFCLSSLDIPVRQFPLEPLLLAFQSLLDRGVRQFKFVDRTFNLNLAVSTRILEFFRDRFQPGLFLHFEMVPDRLPEGLRGLIRQFPPAALQFEVGIQTFNDAVSERIKRRQNVSRLADNLQFLREQTHVHIHADLIAGLPGEDVDSFGAGFDRLIRLRPQEIQIGILKRLRGTPIVRHDQEWAMVYSDVPPYEILQTKDIDFATMQRLRRFSRYWDLIANSGNFVESLALLWLPDGAPFRCFLGFSDWLFTTSGRTHGIALPLLFELFFTYLTAQRRLDASEIAPVVWRDYQRGGHTDRPRFLRPHLPDSGVVSVRHRVRSGAKRQRRHSITS
jgi:hypothetical protein